MVGSTRDYRLGGSMLRNLFGSHVPGDLLLLEDAQSIQIQQYLGSLAVYAALTLYC
jgi:queuine/archaeosine tRNA-ribosyltransferase